MTIERGLTYDAGMWIDRALAASLIILGLFRGVTLAQEAAGSPESGWHAGAAKVAITPGAPMWMAGYAARTKPAIGTLTELWGKVLVLRDGSGQPAVLITLDLVGIDRTLAEAICGPLMEAFGIGRERIAICCSHTHSGPALTGNLTPLHYLQVDASQQDYIRHYTDSLPARIVAAAMEAHAGLQPARLSWGSGTADFAVNRRENSEADVPARRTADALVGPSRHDVPVLAVRGSDDALKAVVFGYACHSTVLDGYRWCGDYPGFAQQELEASHPDCIALFWAGCGADQNPIPRRSVALARHYGQRLATAVDKVLLTSAMQPLEAGLQTHLEELPLAYADLPNREQLAADAMSENRYTAARARMLLDELAAGKELPATYPFPVATWQLGNADNADSAGNSIQFIFLGGETVIDYTLRLQSLLHGRRTWVASYANDVMAYIPSERVLAEGGYEGGGATVYYGLPAPWAAGLEDRIVTAVANQLRPPSAAPPVAPRLEKIGLDAAGRGFVAGQSREAFTIWGVNYDHNEAGQLIEDYWQDDWPQVVEDFGEIKALGANVVRIHLQLPRFMRTATEPDEVHLARLRELLQLAEQTGLYLNLTGLGCYRKADVPEWYDALAEADRWEVQAVFWNTIASVCKDSPAVFCYDLMNEPILDGGDGDGWLTGELGGFHFVQRITRDLAGRDGGAVAGAWNAKLAAAIRRQDQDTLITVGVIPWAHVFPNAKPLFHSPEAGAALDFVSVHFYPKSGEVDKALEALAVYDVGKPLVIEEMFPLSCSIDEMVAFIDRSKASGVDGWTSFYWGKSAAEYRQEATDLPSAIKAAWLERFAAESPLR